MNIFGYPAHCGFYEFDRLSKEVDTTLRTKEIFMGGHIGKYAAKIHNEQELELIKNYWKAAFSSCEGTVIIENGDISEVDAVGL